MARFRALRAWLVKFSYIFILPNNKAVTLDIGPPSSHGLSSLCRVHQSRPIAISHEPVSNRDLNLQCSSTQFSTQIGTSPESVCATGTDSLSATKTPHGERAESRAAWQHRRVVRRCRKGIQRRGTRSVARLATCSKSLQAPKWHSPERRTRIRSRRELAWLLPLYWI